MTALFLMARNMFVSQIYLECGTAPLLSVPREVSISPTTYSTQTHFITAEAFAATGWRVGWLIGPASIIQPTLAATTRIVFCTNSPLQEAAASGLEQAKERQYFEIQRAEYAERRKILVDVFDQLGLKYTLPEGSYFILLVCFDGHVHSSRISRGEIRISPM